MCTRLTAALLAAVLVTGCQSPRWLSRTRDTLAEENAVAARSDPKPDDDVPVVSPDEAAPGPSTQRMLEARAASRGGINRPGDSQDNVPASVVASSNRRPRLESLLDAPLPGRNSISARDGAGHGPQMDVLAGADGHSPAAQSRSAPMTIVPRSSAPSVTAWPNAHESAHGSLQPEPYGLSPTAAREVTHLPAHVTAQGASAMGPQSGMRITPASNATSSVSPYNAGDRSSGPNLPAGLDRATGPFVAPAADQSRVPPDSASAHLTANQSLAGHQTVPADPTGRRWPPAAWPPIDTAPSTVSATIRDEVAIHRPATDSIMAASPPASPPEVQPWPYHPTQATTVEHALPFDVSPVNRASADGPTAWTASAHAASTAQSGPMTMPGPARVSGQSATTDRSGGRPRVLRTGWSRGNSPATLDDASAASPRTAPPSPWTSPAVP